MNPVATGTVLLKKKTLQMNRNGFKNKLRNRIMKLSQWYWRRARKTAIYFTAILFI
jgi:hypothetical protein